MWDILSRLRGLARPSGTHVDPVHQTAHDEAFGTLLADLHQELGAFKTGTDAPDAPDADAPLAVITDFDSARDALVIEAPAEAVDALRPDTITIKPSGNDAVILWDGHPVMQVTGGVYTVTPEAIRVIAVDDGL